MRSTRTGRTRAQDDANRNAGPAAVLELAGRLAEAAATLPAEIAAGFRFALPCGHLMLTITPAQPVEVLTPAAAAMGGEIIPTTIPVPNNADPGTRHKLRRPHRKILEKASAEPTPSKVLITRAGYKPNAYSYAVITELCRWGLLVRMPDGLRLPLEGGR